MDEPLPVHLMAWENVVRSTTDYAAVAAASQIAWSVAILAQGHQELIPVAHAGAQCEYGSRFISCLLIVSYARLPLLRRNGLKHDRSKHVTRVFEILIISGKTLPQLAQTLRLEIEEICRSTA